MHVTVHGLRIEIKNQVRGREIEEDWRTRIARTLALLPRPHVALLQYIGIRDRANYAGGSTNQVSRDPEDGLWIMLDIDGFDPRQRQINNRPPNFHNYTLLHEMGHLVDAHYRGTRWAASAQSPPRPASGCAR